MSPFAGDDLPPGLIERHWLGETSPAEVTMVEAWFLTHPEEYALYTELGPRLREGLPRRTHEAWAQRTAEMAACILHGALADAGKAAEAPAKVAGPATVTKLFRTWPRRGPGQHSLVRTVGFGVAAGAVFLLLVGFATAWLQALRDRPPVVAHAESRVYATARGQRANIRLSDGSTVIVAPGSRLRVAADFGVDRRELYLEGEAYFDVIHDARRPLTVFTANAVTRDVGTAFGVRAYSDERVVRVAVREGIVALSGAGLLRAGDIGRLTADGTVTVRRHTDVEDALGWTHGEFRYDHVPLRIVLADLGRWRGIAVTLADSSLGDTQFTGVLDGIPDASVVERVAATAGLRVFHDGQTLVLRLSSPIQPRN